MDRNPAVAKAKSSSYTVTYDEWVWLWVSWTAGTISLGKGETVGDNVLLSYNDPYPIEVNFINVRGWRSPAAFHFSLRSKNESR